jgi:hypothetical protein
MWYRVNGALPIPRTGNVGKSAIEGQEFYSDRLVTIDSRNKIGQSSTIHEVPASVIPLLAAIALEYDSAALEQIIIDHAISLNEITGMNFDDSSFSGISMNRDWNTPLTPVRITIETIKAFSASDELRRDLYRSVSEKPFARESLGVMHTREKALWPASLINQHAKAIMEPSGEVVPNEFTSYSFTVSAPQTIDELPGNNPIELLRRNGMLTEAVLRKQTGLFDMWEDLLHTADDDHPVQMEILTAFTKVADKETSVLIERGLRSFSVDSSSDDIDGPKTFRQLKAVFDQNRAFSSLLKSPVFRLGLAGIYYLEEENYLKSYPDVFDIVINDQELLLSRVAEDLLSRPASHLGHNDYAAFRKLNLLNLPKQVITFSVEALMIHVLDSLESYLTPNEVVCEDKRFADELACDGIEAMTRTLMPYHQFDPAQFIERRDQIKLSLVRGGFDIKKMKGLSLVSKGKILEEGLGL